MAYDVTSEWDDIHRKLGNYEPLPVIKKQNEYLQENIDHLEELAEKKSQDSFSDEDDDFFEEYKRKQLEQMKEVDIEEENKVPTFDYVSQVNEAGENITVLLNFYQEYSPKSVQINQTFENMAKKYPQIKFLKTVANKCVEKFPDSNLPYILCYKNGKLQLQINKTLILIYPKLTVHSLEHLFGELNIDGFDKVKRENVKGYIQEKLGKKNINREDYDSDEEEREDKQFISNKIFIKY